jgi:hypothetical protein
MAATFEKPDPQVAVRQETKKSLVWIGAVALLVGLGLMILTWTIGTQTKETPPASSDGAKTATEKTTTTKSGPPEGVVLAVLGTGAALIVVGFLFGRISTIKLPGGVEVGISKEAEQETIKKAVEEHPDDLDKAAKVAQHAQALLVQQVDPNAMKPPDAVIEQAVQRASAAV